MVLLEPNSKIGDLAFALRVADSSLAPNYTPGDTLIFDPAIKPKPGDLVVAKLAKDADVIIRKYRPRDKQVIELTPLNDDWPNVQIDNDKIGKIIACFFQGRKNR